MKPIHISNNPGSRYMPGMFSKKLVVCCSLLILLLSTSCKKFLGEYSQNYAFVQSEDDLDELLVGSGYTYPAGSFGWHLLDDDADANPPQNRFPNDEFKYQGLFFWQPGAYLSNKGVENTNESGIYSSFYIPLAALNTILLNATSIGASGGKADKLQRISGEAHFLRGYYYFILANLFGKPFNPASAATDYSVPLKLDPAVEDKFFERASVQEVFDQILSDLLQAEKELDGYNQNSVIRANAAATQALLCRVYLYMQEYEKSIAYADKVLQNKYKLIDLNGPVTGNPFLTLSSSENIFALPASGYDFFDLVSIMKSSTAVYDLNNFRVSDDLIGQYAGNDLRPVNFFENPSGGEFLARKAGTIPDIYQEFSIRLPEVILNKAEALAVSGRSEEASQTIQMLCSERYSESNPLIVTETGAELVNFIREERRRELCFETHRWFDLRRYAIDQQYPFEKTIRHTAYGYDGSGIRYAQGFYELKPYQQDQADYVLPIPQKEILLSQGSLSNETRPERPMAY